MKILVKEELCKSVAEICSSDGMMTMCFIFGKELIWVICVYAVPSGKPDIQKDKFCDKVINK